MNNNGNYRTDLAKEGLREDCPVISQKYNLDDCDLLIERFSVNDSRYVNISISVILSDLSAQSAISIANLISKEISSLYPEICGNVLMVGLGNRNMSVDSVGVRSAELTIPLQASETKGKRLSIIIPGVEESTGISSLDTVMAISDSIAADIAVAVDSLAARSCDHLGKTIQISDAGIRPGSGLGRRKQGINMAALGIPVVSIGVPTVISVNRLTGGNFHPGEGMFVALSQTDLIVESAARIISAAIENAFSD